MFITFEGPDGSGKSTQLKLLIKHLQSININNFIVTREPGGTELGKKIRSLLLDTSTNIDSITELLLFSADRAQHINEKIKPALQNGKIVICDRYIDSTIAYQVGGRQLNEKTILDAIKLATTNLTPDYTFLFDISPKTGLMRATKKESADRMEQEHIDFHKRVRNKYLELANNNKRFIVFDSETKSIKDIQKKVIQEFKRITKNDKNQHNSSNI
jgi:dTMP kinase